MRTLLKEVDGLDWFEGAVMNCIWKGPKLRDILNRAGVDVKNMKGSHVEFACHKVPIQEGASWYGGSIELERAMRDGADVLVALETNGEPLPMKHGYPVRIVVPGVSGCRSVKWLDRITVQSEESKHLYHRFDYKILPPQANDKEAAKQYWHVTPALHDMPVNSVVAIPQTGDEIKLSTAGTIEVKGYALPKVDQGPVVKVEVSTNDGRTGERGDILIPKEGQSKWAWTLRKATIRIDKGSKKRVISRATDKGGNVQTDKPQWNLRGVAYDGFGEVRDLLVV